MIRDYDFHPPHDLRLFWMANAGVLRFDYDVFVAEVRYGDVVVATRRGAISGSRSTATPTCSAGWFGRTGARRCVSSGGNRASR